MDPQGNHQQLQKDQYRLFNNGDIQFVLVDVFMNQSGWLLVDNWKQCGDEGYEIAFYYGDVIQEATAKAKRRNETTVYPTREQTIERVHQIIGNKTPNKKETHKQYADEKLEEMWEEFGDVPVVEDADSLAESSLEGLSVEEGGVLLNEDPYIDEDFYWWPRGTTRDDIWHWFDNNHSEGVAALMYPNEDVPEGENVEEQ